MSKKKRLLSAIGSFFKDLFTKNIPIKAIALLFGLLLWGYVLTIENPEYTKVVRDVEITMRGEQTLTEKGLMLVARELGTTDVNVLCEIGKHSELDASRINCVVDLSSRSISLAEDEDSKVIPLTVTATIQTGYGTITSVDVSTVNVEIARIASRSNLPVSIVFAGTMPEGFSVSAPERMTIAVSGRKSLVDEIAKGVITIDLDAFPINDPETLAGEYSGVYPVQFYNSSNVGLENIFADNGESYSLEVPITIRAYREVEIAPLITVDEGYRYTYTLSRDSVVLYGDRERLLGIASVATEPITALPEMNAEEIAAPLVIPEGVTLQSGDNGRVTVVLTVTETVETREFTVPISLVGLLDTLTRGDRFPTEITVSVTGATRLLNSFSATYVTAKLNLAGCEAGEHTLPIEIDLDQRAGELTVVPKEPNVTVMLAEKQAEP